jgi:hypothetical protein
MAPADLQLAQLNIALPREPLDSPLLAEFVARLDPVNALADAAPGFVWRLQGDDGNATSVRGFDDDRVIVNLSVWESIEPLSDFVYRSGHIEVMRRRREWMERVRQHIVLWWVPSGHRPAVDEAESRLAHLREHGPSPHAFTFKSRFDPGQALLIEHEIGCPA